MYCTCAMHLDTVYPPIYVCLYVNCITTRIFWYFAVCYTYTQHRYVAYGLTDFIMYVFDKKRARTHTTNQTCAHTHTHTATVFLLAQQWHAASDGIVWHIPLHEPKYQIFVLCFYGVCVCALWLSNTKKKKDKTDTNKNNQKKKKEKNNRAAPKHDTYLLCTQTLQTIAIHNLCGCCGCFSSLFRCLFF